MEFEVRDARTKNRFFIDNEFYDLYLATLGSNAYVVYSALCRYADKQQKAWPSQNTLSEETGLSRQTVNAMIGILEDWNIIRRERVGKRSTNRYWLLDKAHWKRTGVMSPQPTSRDEIGPGSDVASADITGGDPMTILSSPDSEENGGDVASADTRCRLSRHPVVTKHNEQVNTKTPFSSPPLPRSKDRDKNVTGQPKEEGSFRETKSFEDREKEALAFYESLPPGEKRKFYSGAIGLKEFGSPVPATGSSGMKKLLVAWYEETKHGGRRAGDTLHEEGAGYDSEAGERKWKK